MNFTTSDRSLGALVLGLALASAPAFSAEFTAFDADLTSDGMIAAPFTLDRDGVRKDVRALPVRILKLTSGEIVVQPLVVETTAADSAPRSGIQVGAKVGSGVKAPVLLSADESLSAAQSVGLTEGTRASLPRLPYASLQVSGRDILAVGYGMIIGTSIDDADAIGMKVEGFVGIGGATASVGYGGFGFPFPGQRFPFGSLDLRASYHYSWSSKGFERNAHYAGLEASLGITFIEFTTGVFRKIGADALDAGRVRWTFGGRINLPSIGK